MTTAPPIAASALIDDLIALLGAEAVLSNPDELVCYECDGFTIPRAKPLAVVFPTSTAQVSEVVKLLVRHGIAILPRGAGTGLTGGIVAVTPSVQVSTARMRTIHHIDVRNRWALVDAGVPNLTLTDHPLVKAALLQFAPDPSSQRASTIGGNVATNAGGIHTLKYGVTNNHILGLELVLSDGSIHTLGGPHGGSGGGGDIGPDLVGLLCGSEGTLGIITKVYCRLTPRPRAFRTALAVFSSTLHACQTVADIIAAGIIPAAMELMDGTMIRVVEDAFHFGFPTDAQAVILIEIDGLELREGGLDEDMAQVEQIARKNLATNFQSSADPERRAEPWSCRKRAFGAIGRISPDYCTQDACVPRSKLPEVITRLTEICAKHGLRATNVFHAGDGNVHPVLMYDASDPVQLQHTLDASHDILHYCISIGGTLTGEHGVGIEKLPHMLDMYSPADIALMHKIRNAFTPDDAMNPYKVLPRENIAISLLHPLLDPALLAKRHNPD